MNNLKEKLLSKKAGKAEILALLIYIAGVILVMCFHEPWFDEAEAWQIARCASLKKIMFEVPHYECHPQLWHLILAIFAKSGAPYELSIKAVNLFFSSAAAAVLIFKSPFPKIVRCLLPFNFYFFYQYGVISRPYSILILSLMLAASGYRERNAHPWKYILPLCLLCLSSAFGILLAGGLCLVWSFEIIRELIQEKKSGSVLKDKRLYPLAFILVLAAFIIISIMPAEDCYNQLYVDQYLGIKNSYLPNFLFLLTLPFESWSGVVYGTGSTMKSTTTMLTDLLIGTLIWILSVALARKNKKTLTFIVPYGFLAGFMSFRYTGPHHLGISTGFFIFFLWIICDKEEGLILPDALKNLFRKFSSESLKKAIYAGLILFCSAPLIYSAVSSYNEITKEYSEAPWADIIKENGLDKTRIMIEWFTYDDDEGGNVISDENVFYFMEQPSKHGKVLFHYPNQNRFATTLMPYFDDNFVMNFGPDCKGENYVHHAFIKNPDAVFDSWAEQGLPDFIINYCYLDEIYDEKTLDGVRYLPVLQRKQYRIYKVDTAETINRLYIREDLLDQYPQFKWIYDPDDPVYDY